MSRPQHPETTELGAPRGARRPSGGQVRPLVDLDSPLSVAELAEEIANEDGWRATWRAMHLSVDEIRALARLAWAASFVVITAEPIGDAIEAGSEVGNEALRAEFSDAIENFIPRFLGPSAASEVEGTVSAPDEAAAEGESAP